MFCGDGGTYYIDKHLFEWNVIYWLWVKLDLLPFEIFRVLDAEKKFEIQINIDCGPLVVRRSKKFFSVNEKQFNKFIPFFSTFVNVPECC